jgi:hypothetical protein
VSDFLPEADQEDELFNPETSCETTPKWHGFLIIRRVAWMTRIKQGTAEYRISKDGIARAAQALAPRVAKSFLK